MAYVQRLPVTTSEGEQRGYNPEFKNSTYFHVYNNLINNERLLRCAKAYGYKIKFLLHPILSSQLEDFTKNDELEVIPSVGDLSYEKILTESSLMVTILPVCNLTLRICENRSCISIQMFCLPHYDDGIFFYDTMGFGEIDIKEWAADWYVMWIYETGCVMKEEYRKRADNFYAQNDHHNCERIYQEIMKFQKQIDIDKLRV